MKRQKDEEGISRFYANLIQINLHVLGSLQRREGRRDENMWRKKCLTFFKIYENYKPTDLNTRTMRRPHTRKPNQKHKEDKTHYNQTSQNK